MNIAALEFGHLHLLEEENPFQLYQSLVIQLGVLPRDLAKFRLLLSIEKFRVRGAREMGLGVSYRCKRDVWRAEEQQARKTS